MFRFIFPWLISLLTFFLHAAPAAEFVVNQQDSAASDENPGSREKPLKTISAAVARVHAGDRVLVHRGEYRETIIVKASGTSDAPIVIEAAPEEVVVIKGSDVVSGWTLDHEAVWKAELPELPPRSTDAADPSFWIATEIHRVFVHDGVLLDAVHLRKVASRDAVQPGSFFHDRANSTLYVWLPDSGDPNKSKMEAAVRGAWINIVGSHIIVRGLQMRHASTLAIANWPACNIYGEGSRLENCVITWGDFAGVSLSGNRNSLVHCVVACHGSVGIGGTGEGHLIEGCRVIYNNIDRYDPGWHCGGAKLIPQFSHGRITKSEFAHNIGPGLWLDGRCNDNLIEANLCHDNEGAGIMVEASAGNHILNNICFGNRNVLAANFLNPDIEAAKRNEHNRFRPVHRGGELFSQLLYHAGDGRGIYISSSPKSKVYNNTCYLNEAEGICVEGPLRMDGLVSLSTRDCEVLNNISVYNKGTQLVVRRNGKDNDTHGNNSDFNVLLALGAVFAQAGWDSPFVSSLKQWQQVTADDRHSIAADPAFVMATMGDFRLQPDSPALGAGKPLPEVKTDFFGQPRPDQKVSIGACELSEQDYPRLPFELSR